MVEHLLATSVGWETNLITCPTISRAMKVTIFLRKKYR